MLPELVAQSQGSSFEAEKRELIKDEAVAGEVGELLQALQLATRQISVKAAQMIEAPRQAQAPAAVTGQLGALARALAESKAREDALQSSIKEAEAERQELKAELEKQGLERARLVQGLTKVVSSTNHDHLVSQLSYGYRQLQVLQEERLTAQERQRCQAYGQQLVELEAEVYDRGRELVLARQSAQELQTIRVLASLEQKRCSFLERQLDDQAKVWPWLREKQAQLEEYRQLATIYHEELRSASEIVEVLQAESQSWEDRLKEAATAEMAKTEEGRDAPVAAADPTLAESVPCT